jgi:D-glycero-D-manno-heptose 1,7-bisphosphate phosphatase
MTNAAATPAAFVDRDGVINADLHHVFRVADFHLLPQAVAGLRSLAAQGFALIVVTNQAGIAKGLYDEDAYQGLTAHMQALLLAQGVHLQGVYHCPHHPQGTVARYAVSCFCRKPEPGMLLQAAVQLNLDLQRSVLVGDKVSDTQAGRTAGLRRTVLVESGHKLPADAALHADQRCADLAVAADWIRNNY